ncbi:MAG TPA: DMT family transporter [Thermoanaerobaculia bacterium]|nr:DMT family transporter [Thermoanaerobaculia bacterium]
MIVGAALLWSTGGIGIKAVVEGPLVVTFYRSLFAAVVLFLLLRPKVVKLTVPFAIATVSYGACLTTFVIATKLTTAANAIFLQSSGVIWVLLLSPLFLGERFRMRDGIAVVVAICGMALFFVGELEPKNQLGNATAALSSVFFAMLIMSLRRERGASAEAAICYGNLLLALALLPFVASNLRLAPVSIPILLGLGVVQIGAAYVLFVRGLSHVTATEASLIGMIEPIANPLWVFLFLGERPRTIALLGGAIVLAAIAWRTSGSEAEELREPGVKPSS